MGTRTEIVKAAGGPLAAGAGRHAGTANNRVNSWINARHGDCCVRLGVTRQVSTLGVIAAAWLAGLGLASVCPEGGWRLGVALAALALGGLGAFVGGSSSARRKRLAAIAGGLAALLAGLGTRLDMRDVGVPIGQGEARVEGIVERVREGEAVLRVTGGARLEDGAALPLGARVRVRPALGEHGRVVVEGARVRLLARVRAAAQFRNPTPHPRWRAGPPLDAEARVRRGTVIETLETPAWDAALGGARASVRRALGASLSPRTAGISRALVLGDGDAVDEGANRAVRNAGLAHVLAVSGLHVVILVGLFVLALRRALMLVPALAARVDVTRVAAAVGVPLALVYAAFAGGAPSAWRAAVAASVSFTLVACGRRPRAGPIAALAAVVVAAWSPGEAMRPALLLSVLATAALLTGAQHGGAQHVGVAATSDMPLPRDSVRALLRASVTASVRTTLATAPLVVWCFEGVPLVGVLANVALVPVGSFVLLPLAALHAVVATLAPPLAPLTAAPLETSTRAFMAACEAFAAVPIGRGLPPLSIAEGLAVAATCALLFAVRTWRARLVVLALGALALCAAELQLRDAEAPRGVLRVTFLDVGQGDSALLDMPDGTLLMVDAGGAPRGGPDRCARARAAASRAAAFDHRRARHHAPAPGSLRRRARGARRREGARALGRRTGRGRGAARRSGAARRRRAEAWDTRARPGGALHGRAHLRQGAHRGALALPHLRHAARAERQLTRAARHLRRTHISARG